jgi:hypothetical protein
MPWARGQLSGWGMACELLRSGGAKDDGRTLSQQTRYLFNSDKEKLRARHASKRIFYVYVKEAKLLPLV